MDPYPTVENWTAAPGTVAPADGNYSTQPVIPNGAERSEESLQQPQHSEAPEYKGPSERSA
jgi:hypothetical protein